VRGAQTRRAHVFSRLRQYAWGARLRWDIWPRGGHGRLGTEQVLMVAVMVAVEPCHASTRSRQVTSTGMFRDQPLQYPGLSHPSRYQESSIINNPDLVVIKLEGRTQVAESRIKPRRTEQVLHPNIPPPSPDTYQNPPHPYQRLYHA